MNQGPSLTTGEIAAFLGADLLGPGDLRLDDFGPLPTAGPTSLSFVRTPAYARQWASSRAGATLVTREVFHAPDAAAMQKPPGGRAVLVVDDADQALILLLEQAQRQPFRPTDVHARSDVDPSAELRDGVTVGAFASVGPDSKIGPGTVVHSGVRIGAGVEIGAQCELFPNVVIYDGCVLGDGVILHSGVIIGADGFGYRPSPDGPGVIKIPHVGNVVIGDAVEIGANSCVDRGKLGATRIGDGTKLDNLVQIGHNCTIGRCCIICGCARLAGSTSVGDGVTFAGGAGVADNLTVGDGATIAAYGGVMHNVPPGETWAGFPAEPHRSWVRRLRMERQLMEIIKPLREMVAEREQAEGQVR
jgi:UDP-3-O-[3-hydroxymyristoyl] glucosamine N-acyltransferase